VRKARLNHPGEWVKESTLVDITNLPNILKVSFKNPSLLEQAMVHSSYVNENPGLRLEANERFEFLGDAILGLIIAEKLYEDYPDLTEGQMTRLRSALVRRDTLAHIARTLKLGDYLFLGRGEAASGGRHKTANLARAFEALIAAVFLDRGLIVTRRLVLKLFQGELAKLIQQGRVTDYKSQLQELIQSKYRSSPYYRVIEAEGPDHARLFTVEVIGGGVVLGKGSGKSKKLAEAEAARNALERLIDFTP